MGELKNALAVLWVRRIFGEQFLILENGDKENTHPTFIMSLHLLIDIKRLISKLNPIICFLNCIIILVVHFTFVSILWHTKKINIFLIRFVNKTLIFVAVFFTYFNSFSFLSQTVENEMFDHDFFLLHTFAFRIFLVTS